MNKFLLFSIYKKLYLWNLKILNIFRNNSTYNICLSSLSICSGNYNLFYYLQVHSILPMAPDSSTLAWKIPWTEELGRLQSTGSLRVGHDWPTSLSLFTFMHWRRKWQPTPVFLPGESQGRGSLVGCHLWGRTESDTMKRLSSSSSSSSTILPEPWRGSCLSFFTSLCFYHTININLYMRKRR